MKRTVSFPLLVAFIVGAVTGGLLLPAQAQRPAPDPAATCETRLAKRDGELRRARRLTRQAEVRAHEAQLQAEAASAQARRTIDELEARLRIEQVRVKKLERVLRSDATGIIE